MTARAIHDSAPLSCRVRLCLEHASCLDEVQVVHIGERPVAVAGDVIPRVLNHLTRDTLCLDQVVPVRARHEAIADQLAEPPTVNLDARRDVGDDSLGVLGRLHLSIEAARARPVIGAFGQSRVTNQCRFG